ncbi:MAG: HEAT repeat domain-containing protein [Myxococcota bacterium]
MFLLQAGSSARAQDRPIFDVMVADLDADDADAIRAALEDLAASRSRAAVQPIARRIRRGLPPPLVVPAIEALELIGHASAGPVLEMLLRHRSAEVRAAAAAAVAEVEARRAGPALRAALDDPDPNVRATAALALGRVGDRRATPDLFRALERGLYEASASLGQLVRAPDVARYLGYLRRLPLSVLTPGLTEMLARRDLPNATKLEIVEAVGAVGSIDAKRYLEELVLLFGDAPIARAARTAAEAIGG